MATGHAADDTASVCAVLERMAGLDRAGGGRLTPSRPTDNDHPMNRPPARRLRRKRAWPTRSDIGVEPPHARTGLTRRAALLGGAGTGVLASRAARAQSDPIRLGFLTVKTGPLAAGGIQMEQGLALYFKDRGNQLAGRPVQLFTADTGGTPANARTKTQELVERNNVFRHHRPACGVRAAGHRRLPAGEAGPLARRRRRRGHHPAQPQPLVRARQQRPRPNARTPWRSMPPRS